MALGIAHMHSAGIIHRNLCLENVCVLDEVSVVKLSNWATFYLLDGGIDAESDPVGHVLYQSPQAKEPLARASDDVWALGILILELYIGKQFSGGDNQAELDVLNSWTCDSIKLPSFLDKHLDDSSLRSFVGECLTIDHQARPTMKQILTHEFLHPSSLREKLLWQPYPIMQNELLELASEGQGPFDNLSLAEIFHLWKLENPSFEGFMKSDTLPAVLCLPKAVSKGSDVDHVLYTALATPRGQVVDKKSMLLDLKQLSDTLVNRPLPRQTYKGIKRAPSFQSLNSSLNTSSPASRYSRKVITWNEPQLGTFLSTPQNFNSQPPVKEKEADPGYQYNRILLFKSLISEYPLSAQDICEQARLDIPPCLRGRIWAALLKVEGDTEFTFDSIDVDDISSETKKQIDLDVPRCHSYSLLTSSERGKAKLKRILKAWVRSNENSGLVYWQGLDSVCSVFVSVNFGDEVFSPFCFYFQEPRICLLCKLCNAILPRLFHL